VNRHALSLADEPLCRFADVLAWCDCGEKTQALTESEDSSGHILHEL
jgi:hypothetical protein